MKEGRVWHIYLQQDVIFPPQHQDATSYIATPISE
jgi:hypothetical protein